MSSQSILKINIIIKMKRSLYFSTFILCCIWVLSSCSDKDKVKDSDLIGGWEWIQTGRVIEATPENVKAEIEIDLYEEVYHIIFKDNNTGLFAYRVDLEDEDYTDFRYKVRGNLLTVTYIETIKQNGELVAQEVTVELPVFKDDKDLVLHFDKTKEYQEKYKTVDNAMISRVDFIAKYRRNY